MKQERKLSEICNIFSGSRPKGGAISSGVLSIGAEHISSDGYFDLSNPKYIPEKYFKNLKRGILKSGDILLVKDGATTGKVGFFGNEAPFTEGAVNEHVFVLRVNDSKVIIPQFIYYFLKSKTGNNAILKRKVGSAQGGINLSIGDIKIVLPTLSEQQDIVSLLEEIDDLRQKQRKAIELTRQMIPALFYEMFGDPITNSMRWDVVRLGDHSSKVGSGATPKGGDSSYKAEGIALIRSLNVRDGEFRWKDLARIDDTQASTLSNVIVEENDVLLNITGASVARVCCAPKEVLPARVNQHVCIIRTTSKVQPRFLESLLLSSSMKNRLLRIGESGATRQAITKAQVLALEIPLPPVELQKIFIQKAQECLSLLEHQEQSLQKLDALFETTLNQFFYQDNL